ncbi:hypothetical protein K9L67_01755 [Candidatus Woesearchaeota archaeon]|nr:hypothetical protein [Candidatus Woesearchaeota archaeon]MCF7900929.1 hypothetical protein [Candidatus Woesearchaeota archaeon]MCF8012873.1 hypothetical protein [Candidatus Woesearchaeota archaeon]
MKLKNSIKLILGLMILLLIVGTTSALKLSNYAYELPDTILTTPHNLDITSTITITEIEKDNKLQSTTNINDIFIEIEQPINPQNEIIKTTIIKDTSEEEALTKSEKNTKDITIQASLTTLTRPETYIGTIKIYNKEKTEMLGKGYLIINATNTAPLITSSKNFIVNKNQETSIQITATDDEEDNIIFSLNPDFDKGSITSAGLLTVNLSETTNLEIKVTDNHGEESKKTINFEIANSLNNQLSVDKTSIDLGGNNLNRELNTTKEINITNKGTKVLKNIQIEALKINGVALDEKYKVQTTIAKSTLDVGESTTAQITLTVPKDKNSKK